MPRTKNATIHLRAVGYSLSSALCVDKHLLCDVSGDGRWFPLAVLEAAVTPDEVSVNQPSAVNAVVLLNQIILNTQAAKIPIKNQMSSPFHALDIKNRDSVILDLQGT